MTKEPWQAETEGYIPRIDAARRVLAGASDPLRVMPPAPLSFEPTREQQLAIQLMIFNLGAIRATEQLYDTFVQLWSEGRFVGISMPIRLAMEFWGALAFGRAVLADFKRDGGLAKAIDRSARLMTGARSPVRLPRGGYSEVKPYSVMEYVRCLDDRTAGTLGDYEFLCEACHPNFLQNTYFFMASPVFDNWSNDAFREHAHSLLGRTVTVAETVAAGLVNDTQQLLALAADRL